MKNLISQLIANTRGQKKRGFTLIELLIVIGILGILVVAVLLTLNPAESQRKARDLKRMKDLSTLQTIMDQAVNDNVLTAANWSAAGSELKNSSGGTQGCAVDASWLTTGGTGVSLCAYSKTIPVDPTNKSTTVAGNSTDAACSSAATQTAFAYYFVAFDPATQTYEVNVRQESSNNCGNITKDGGTSFVAVEAGTDLDLINTTN